MLIALFYSSWNDYIVMTWSVEPYLNTWPPLTVLLFYLRYINFTCSVYNIYLCRFMFLRQTVPWRFWCTEFRHASISSVHWNRENIFAVCFGATFPFWFHDQGTVFWRLLIRCFEDRLPCDFIIQWNGSLNFQTPKHASLLQEVTYWVR
jgi:hypothetical protein